MRITCTILPGYRPDPMPPPKNVPEESSYPASPTSTSQQRTLVDREIF